MSLQEGDRTFPICLNEKSDRWREDTSVLKNHSRRCLATSRFTRVAAGSPAPSGRGGTQVGNVIKLEKLNYKAFQKLFGKSVARRAPGMFVTHLRSKAERAGAKVVEIPTYSTKLSQTCQCGRVRKKKLSERIHKCECGVIAQRDLYSALLAKHIEPDTFVLQVSQLVNEWQSAQLRLKAAWRAATECNQPATGRIRPSSFGRCPEVERVAAEILAEIPKNQDVVAATREPGRGCGLDNSPVGSDSPVLRTSPL